MGFQSRNPGIGKVVRDCNPYVRPTVSPAAQLRWPQKMVLPSSDRAAAVAKDNSVFFGNTDIDFEDNMAIIRTVYHTLLKRTSTFALTIVGGAFVFERIFDQGSDYLFEYLNQGVSLYLFAICKITEGHPGILDCPAASLVPHLIFPAMV
jgi:ubiquinol-cytochrome c reductase subunit 9